MWRRSASEQYLWERTKLGADVCRRTDNIQPMKDPKANARGSRQKVERKEKENVSLSSKQAGCVCKTRKEERQECQGLGWLVQKGASPF
ncbi:Protein transport protein SEC23 [Fusarium oxysporum f. sp. albedinis]|jgi:hypothetical protein|nr:Protein transport protein SEC23 [Fusarium oxysporum f. sp. albedinis]